MCGFITVFNPEQGLSNKSRLSSERLTHRGPDSSSEYIDEEIYLGFRRLSIIDLSDNGTQPMRIGDHVMVFNGEIYNYIEIRKSLIELGYSFKSNTDTEVLLRCYLHFGEKFLELINGMFSICIYSIKSKSLRVYRDRFGIKPLYFFRDGNTTVIASEIKAITPHVSNLEANESVVANYLLYGRTDYSSETFYQGIVSLDPGCSLSISTGTFKLTRWYKLEDSIDKPFISVDEYQSSLRSSIELRMRSDVAFGAALSGGLDSSTIVGLMNEINKEPVRCYSAVYKENHRSNELKYIKEFDDKVVDLNLVYLDGHDLLRDYRELIVAHDEPFSTPSIYSQFRVMKLARETSTVVLNGQGADESLGGYDYSFSVQLYQHLREGRLDKFTSNVLTSVFHHNGLYGIKYLPFYMMSSGLRKRLLKTRGVPVRMNFLDSIADDKDYSDYMYSTNNVKDHLLNHFNFKLEHLLKWDDINSMANSVESRVPFLDHNHVEKSIGMSLDFNWKGGRNKMILRDMKLPNIPNVIYNRKEKIGFATPVDRWFRTEAWKKEFGLILKSDVFMHDERLDQIAIEKLFENHIAGKSNNSKLMWRVINYLKWNEQFL